MMRICPFAAARLAISLPVMMRIEVESMHYSPRRAPIARGLT